MKRALVLSGGGSRGAYECGAWQALTELNIRIDAVYGTSIGAINAALVAQGDLETARQLWENIRIGDIVALKEGEEFSVERMVHRKRDLLPFIMENAKNFLMDIGPFEAMIREKICEGKVRASGMELGVMTTRVPSLAARPFHLKDIPVGSLHDCLLASAACFPIFPLRQMDGERYMDGGYADNLPVSMAIADGAEEIIAVDVHPQPVHPEFSRMPCIKWIHPLYELGGFLNFEAEQLRRCRLMGYHDTMKAYGQLDGICYTFTRVNDLKLADEARLYMQKTALFDACLSGRDGEAVLNDVLLRETPLRSLNRKEYLLRGLELCAQLMGFREDAIYDVHLLTQRIADYVRSQDDGIIPDERKLNEAAKDSARSLFCCITNAMALDGEFLPRHARYLAEYPAETAAALYLNTMR